AFAWGCGVLVTQLVSLLTTGSKFPWLDLAGPQVDRLWVIQIADLGGSFVVALIIALINGVVWVLCTGRDRSKAVVLGLASLGSMFLYGQWRLGNARESRPVSVGLMVEGSPPAVLEDAACDVVRGADLLIWPEEVLGADGLSEAETIQKLQRC